MRHQKVPSSLTPKEAAMKHKLVLAEHVARNHEAICVSKARKLLGGYVGFFLLFLFRAGEREEGGGQVSGSNEIGEGGGV